MPGIQQTADVLRFGAILGKTIGHALSDGSLDLFDLVKLFPLIGPLNDALVGIDEVPSELQDLDSEERAELLRILREEFSFTSDEAEERLMPTLDAGRNLLRILR